jgi:hypothetical protein
MANSVKFLIIVVLLAAAIGAFIYYYANYSGDVWIMESGKNNQAQEVEKPEDVAIPTATGDIDKTIDALLEEMNVDFGAFGQEENDKNLLGSDSQAISNLGQSYDEKEF